MAPTSCSPPMAWRPYLLLPSHGASPLAAPLLWHPYLLPPSPWRPSAPPEGALLPVPSTSPASSSLLFPSLMAPLFAPPPWAAAAAGLLAGPAFLHPACASSCRSPLPLPASSLHGQLPVPSLCVQRQKTAAAARACGTCPGGAASAYPSSFISFSSGQYSSPKVVLPSP
ncbi:hypothetical protein U9M48_031831 [Paspalum notatum var. saurae]|uniref:Uncharacterized protein n=1 Tax=Paspalum notatum var. saurae TaxID=547442 RepID=A0AAQ3U4Q5_PASNO